MDKDGDLMGRERYRRGERRRDWGGVKGKEIEMEGETLGKEREEGDIDGGRETGREERRGRHIDE